MIKFKTLIMVLLNCVLLYSFIGCSPNNSNDTKGDNNIVDSNIVENGCYLLADFENYEQITQMKLGWTFGKVTPITNEQDPEKVTHGKQCIKAEVLGREEMRGGKLSPFLGFKTNGIYFQKADFTDCESFLVDIFSAMDYEIKVDFYVNDLRNEVAYSQIELPYRIEIRLQPGKNSLEIPIDENLLEGRPQTGIYKNVSDFGFVFDRGELHEETQTFYIDNLRAKKINE